VRLRRPQTTTNHIFKELKLLRILDDISTSFCSALIHVGISRPAAKRTPRCLRPRGASCVVRCASSIFVNSSSYSSPPPPPSGQDGVFVHGGGSGGNGGSNTSKGSARFRRPRAEAEGNQSTGREPLEETTVECDGWWLVHLLHCFT